MAAIDDKIAHLEGLLDNGVTSITVDGVTSRIDPDQIRQRLRELYRQRDARPQAVSINLSGGYDSY